MMIIKHESLMIHWIDMTCMAYTEHLTLASHRFSSLWEKIYFTMLRIVQNSDYQHYYYGKCEASVLCSFGNFSKIPFTFLGYENYLGAWIHFNYSIHSSIELWTTEGKKGQKLSHFSFIHAKKYYYLDCVWKVNIQNHHTLQP